MSKKIFKINYEALRPMDIVYTGARNPWAACNRLFTAGWRDMFNYKIPTHCGVLVQLYGQYLIAEMLGGRGLQLESLKKYTTKRNHILAVRRHHVYNSSLVREAAQARIALDLRYTLDYDPKGIMSFVLKRVEDDPKKWYCSEYVYMQSAADGIIYPDSFADRVSPNDLYKATSGCIDIDFKLK